MPKGFAFYQVYFIWLTALSMLACGDADEIPSLPLSMDNPEADSVAEVPSRSDTLPEQTDVSIEPDIGESPEADGTSENETDGAVGSFTDTTLPGADTSVVRPDPGGGIQRGFFAVHLDPGPIPKEGDFPNASRPKAHLEDLTALVEKADEWGHQLTLMFTGQWAYHMADPTCLVPLQEGSPPGTFNYKGTAVSDCLALIRAFELHGHEISMHHHPAGAPASWDGYANEPPTGPDLSQYLGTVDDLLALVGEVSANGMNGITSCTTEEFPLGPHAIRVTSARGPTPYVDADSRGDLASVPCAWVEDGNPVWRLRMRSAGNMKMIELDSAFEDLEGSASPYTVGFVTHAKDVESLGIQPYQLIFARLAEGGVTLQGLTSVVGAYPFTGGPPNPVGPHACPPDENLE